VTFRSHRTLFRTSLVAAALLFSAAANAESVTVEVQGVTASDPGKKEIAIPASIDHLKVALKDTVFGTFKDSGKQSITATTGVISTARAGIYDVDITLKAAASGKCRMDVTIKNGGKPIGDPICIGFTKGQPKMVAQVGNREAPTLVIFTIKE